LKTLFQTLRTILRFIPITCLDLMVPKHMLWVVLLETKMTKRNSALLKLESIPSNLMKKSYSLTISSLTF